MTRNAQQLAKTCSHDVIPCFKEDQEHAIRGVTWTQATEWHSHLKARKIPARIVTRKPGE